ncbi:indigoidine synthase a family [Plasmopara halstedii]|uniref:Indigoidine synthase a family n=1 Tax=Plasmopara halstedii TaxID=4781 RepID=A0A0P1ASA3_PLAHL|nr:indigoidine synthase a family [Plasmopara halstedii]CEG44687.1 indigoidine synthase a family [Plasmopara halstedii]|eukprot:XP_024581056.1 indigoidine synthase a family [Plasmopara halstedii]
MWRRGSALRQRLALSEEVSEALYGRVKKPVVALESTIISHGMPFPQNLHMAKHVEEIVRSHGACPATICIADGKLKVGLTEKDLVRLAELGVKAKKCSTRDIAAAVTEKKMVGATTVSSTMRIAYAAGIKVFVTGGIGGVHRFCEETMDISTDLMELSRTPVAVVCAGVKSILDIPRTLEYLETHSVPVIGYQTDQFPAFFTQDSGEKAQLRCDTPENIARLIFETDALEMSNGHLIAVPNPKPVPSKLINDAIEHGLKEVLDKKIHGQAVTPYLLKRVNEITQGLSLNSNIDLVNNNATVGSQIACALFDLMGSTCYNSEADVTYSLPEKKASVAKTSSQKRVLVVGGLVLDIISSSTSRLIHGTSNIGTIKQSSGGVGRNIAECLHRLQLEPLLVSTVGNDSSSSILLEDLKRLGMDTSGITVSGNLSTAVCSAILDSGGDMDAAIADMSAFESINSEAISDQDIGNAKLVIADGNLSSNTIGDLFMRSSRLGVDTWFEPTSVQKSVRVLKGNGITFTKYMSPNVDELYAISDAVQSNLKDKNVGEFFLKAQKSFDLLRNSRSISMSEMTRLKNSLITVLLAMADDDTKKTRHVLVTMGKHGVLVASINMVASDLHEMVKECDFDVEIWGMQYVDKVHFVTMVHLPGFDIAATNCTGAGDSMVGGTVYGLLKGHHIFRSCHMGMIAARESLVSEHAISPDISPEKLCR